MARLLGINAWVLAAARGHGGGSVLRFASALWLGFYFTCLACLACSAGQGREDLSAVLSSPFLKELRKAAVAQGFKLDKEGGGDAQEGAGAAAAAAASGSSKRKGAVSGATVVAGCWGKWVGSQGAADHAPNGSCWMTVAEGWLVGGVHPDSVQPFILATA